MWDRKESDIGMEEERLDRVIKNREEDPPYI